MGAARAAIGRGVADALVVGDGPAGLALAAELGSLGCAVVLLAPDPDAPWPATYGVWLDELPPAAPGEVVAASWSSPLVVGRERHVLNRPYSRLANDPAKGWLMQRAEAAGVVVRRGRAAGVTHQAASTTVGLEGGGTQAARLVVDATGHRPALLPMGRVGPLAFQTAYGIVAEVERPPHPAGSMALMDFSDDGWRGDRSARGTPTFLYAMDAGDGSWFLEETSLAARPGLGREVLARRLDQRLAAAGVRVTRVHDTEHVRFPMGVAIPDRGQRVVAWGAAAGMVHPATGYSVGTALRRAPEVARAVAAALGRPLVSGTAPGAQVARAAWDAVWPADLRRQRALHAYGLEALLRFGTARTQAFISTFFALPDADWRGYLSGAPSVAALRGTMWRLYRDADADLRRGLLRGALGGDLAHLARSLTG